MENIVVFLNRKVFISAKFSIVSDCQECDIYNIHHKCKISDKIYNHTLSDKAYQGTFVNQELTSLHGGSLEITLTVPIQNTYKNNSNEPF